MSGQQGWGPKARNYGWIVLASARRELCLSVSPCIATAYSILHRYFRSPHVRSHRPYLLLTASLFLSCKIAETYRSVTCIFREIASSITRLQSRVKSSSITAIFGPRDFTDSSLTDPEFAEMANIEIDFLNAIDWNTHIPLPFDYFSEIRIELESLASRLGDDVMCHVLQLVLRDICAILRDERYLDLPPSVTAAASVAHSFTGISIPPKLRTWIDEKKLSSPREFTCAMDIVTSQPCCDRVACDSC